MAYTRFSGKKYTKGGWVGNIPPSETYIMGSFYALECLCCRLLPKVKAPDEFLDRHDETRRQFNAKHDAHLPMVKRPYYMWDTFHTNSRRAMLKHIRQHRKAGHAVPRAAWRRLVREIRTQGDEY